MVYNNAPIQEAVFDIRVRNVSIHTIDELKRIKKSLPEEFKKIKKRQDITGKFEFDGDKSIKSETQTKQSGFIFLNECGSRQVQVRRNGLSLNVLKPYEDWDTHFPCFMNLWKSYTKLFKPEITERVAVRYINKINLPLPFESFQKYITNVPPIPENLPRMFAKFFMQTEVPCNNELSKAIITETFEDPDEEKKYLPFILDIDVSQDKNLPDSFSEIENLFNEFRKIKNETFESCITDNTRELIS